MVYIKTLMLIYHFQVIWDPYGIEFQEITFFHRGIRFPKVIELYHSHQVLCQF